MAAVTLLVALVAAIVVFVRVANERGWVWTGFLGEPADVKGDGATPPKRLWDWLDLLAVPLVIAAAVAGIGYMQSLNEAARADRRAEVDGELALDAQRERSLQDYLDEMTGLMLEKKLLSSPEFSEVRQVARTRTLTTLRTLDGARKGQVVRFLSEAFLVFTPDDPGEDVEPGQPVDNPIVDLSGADLSGAQLAFSDLGSIYLKGAQMRQADLTSADLTDSDLSSADLSEACLATADLGGATLYDTSFAGAYLPKANLSGAAGTPDFSFANLNDAKGRKIPALVPRFDATEITDSTDLDAVEMEGTVAPNPDPHSIYDRWPHCNGTPDQPRYVALEEPWYDAPFYDGVSVASLGSTIPGLTAADVLLKFAKGGLSCSGTARRFLDGVQYTCGIATDTPVGHYVAIQGMNRADIRRVEASIYSHDTSLDSSADLFLGDVATLPYKGATPDLARAWVETNDTGEMRFGAATYTLRTLENIGVRTLWIDGS